MADGNTNIDPTGTPVSTIAGLDTAIATFNGETAAGVYEIDLAGGTIPETQAITAIDQTHAGVDLIINGLSNGADTVLDGQSTHQGFVVTSGTVTLEDLTIQNAVAQGQAGGSAPNSGGGGGGGGGGAGLGGGVFVGEAAVVILEGVGFSHDTAHGGAGGAGATGSYGAGGVGGAAVDASNAPSNSSALVIGGGGGGGYGGGSTGGGGGNGAFGGGGGGGGAPPRPAAVAGPAASAPAMAAQEIRVEPAARVAAAWARAATSSSSWAAPW